MLRNNKNKVCSVIEGRGELGKKHEKCFFCLKNPFFYDLTNSRNYELNIAFSIQIKKNRRNAVFYLFVRGFIVLVMELRIVIISEQSAFSESNSEFSR